MELTAVASEMESWLKHMYLMSLLVSANGVGVRMSMVEGSRNRIWPVFKPQASCNPVIDGNRSKNESHQMVKILPDSTPYVISGNKHVYTYFPDSSVRISRANVILRYPIKNFTLHKNATTRMFPYFSSSVIYIIYLSME